MKKLCLLGLVLLGACSKKDAAPAYQDFTPISGRFTIKDNGFLRYNERDTTAVLSDLQLRIYRLDTLAIYEFQGRRSRHEVDNIQFSVGKSHTGTGPWTGLDVRTSYLVDGKPYAQGGSNRGTLSASGNVFTAFFDNSGYSGYASLGRLSLFPSSQPIH